MQVGDERAQRADREVEQHGEREQQRRPADAIPAHALRGAPGVQHLAAAAIQTPFALERRPPARPRPPASRRRTAARLDGERGSGAVARRSASSASTPSARPQRTSANSSSPNASKPRLALAAGVSASSRAAASSSAASAAAPPRRAAARAPRARAPAGSRARRRTARSAPRPSRVRLISSQLRRTASAPVDLDLAEHVRVAADQLLDAVVGDRGEVAGAALLEQQRQEVDLEEDVAELVEQLRVIAGVGRVGELVGLLDGVRDDRRARPGCGPTGSRAAAAGSAHRAAAKPPTHRHSYRYTPLHPKCPHKRSPPPYRGGGRSGGGGDTPLSLRHTAPKNTDAPTNSPLPPYRGGGRSGGGVVTHKQSPPPIQRRGQVGGVVTHKQSAPPYSGGRRVGGGGTPLSLRHTAPKNTDAPTNGGGREGGWSIYPPVAPDAVVEPFGLFAQYGIVVALAAHRARRPLLRQVVLQLGLGGADPAAGRAAP